MNKKVLTKKKIEAKRHRKLVYQIQVLKSSCSEE